MFLVCLGEPILRSSKGKVGESGGVADNGLVLLLDGAGEVGDDVVGDGSQADAVEEERLAFIAFKDSLVAYRCAISPEQM